MQGIRSLPIFCAHVDSNLDAPAIELKLISGVRGRTRPITVHVDEHGDRWVVVVLMEGTPVALP
jgi:hypothetical protein